MQKLDNAKDKVNMKLNLFLQVFLMKVKEQLTLNFLTHNYLPLQIQVNQKQQEKQKLV